MSAPRFIPTTGTKDMNAIENAIKALEKMCRYIEDGNVRNKELFEAFTAARAALPGLIAMRDGAGWMPIETAPKDGTAILVFTKGCPLPAVAWWNAHWGAWVDSGSEAEADACEEMRSAYNPDAWMPLPGSVQHDSDCAVHNAPALPVGPCDCGAEG